MTNWTQVTSDAIAAAQGVLGASWTVASAGATAQINQLVQTAQYIEANTANMTPAETQFLMAQQKVALQNILTTYASIALAAAINTVNAVINVIITSAPAIAGFI